jgi:hypothetical protein
MKHQKALWKSFALILCFSAGYVLWGGQSSFQPRKVDPGAAPAGKPVVSYAKLPLSFEPNQGQTDARVKFLARGPGYTLFVTSDEVVLALKKAEGRRADFEIRNSKFVARNSRLPLAFQGP